MSLISDIGHDRLDLEREFLQQLVLRFGCDNDALEGLLAKYVRYADGKPFEDRLYHIDGLLDQKAMESLGLCDE
jgi:hypothetical protein